MNALQELVHLRKAWSIIGLAWIATVVEVVHDLGKELRVEHVCLLNWLNVFHNHESTWFNALEPEKEGLNHVAAKVASIIHYHLEGRRIWTLHGRGPSAVQEFQVRRITAMKSIGIAVALIVLIDLRRVFF